MTCPHDHPAEPVAFAELKAEAEARMNVLGRHYLGREPRDPWTYGGPDHEPSLWGAVRNSLERIGQRGACRGCGRVIWWIKHADTGRLAPYTEEAVNHFSDCPEADAFRRRKGSTE